MFKIAIVIPEHKSKLPHFEKVALDRCFKIFNKYPIIFALPASADVQEFEYLANKNKADFNCIRFPDTDFSNNLAYNHLLVTKRFYEYFKEYDYILLYQTDCFVFRDELEYWCGKGYDYIGAPFINDFDSSTDTSPFFGVGNGGFSLRKVSTFLKVFKHFAYVRSLDELIAINRKKKGLEKLLSPISLIKNLTISNNTYHLFNHYYDHEDMFWGRFVNRKFDWFKVAPIEEAIPFSFDVQPRKLYEMNKQQLPFGCHAWWRFDLDFWKPFIEQEGYSLETNAKEI